MPILTAITGALGAMGLTRFGMAVSGTASNPLIKQSIAQRFFKMPLIHGGQFGVGYTGGAYLGYGGTNTGDPLGLHKPKYKPVRSKLGMPYGYGYGRRRYRRRYGYSRYSSYRSRYGRRRPYYRRRYY